MSGDPSVSESVEALTSCMTRERRNLTPTTGCGMRKGDRKGDREGGRHENSDCPLRGHNRAWLSQATEPCHDSSALPSTCRPPCE